MTRRRVIFFDVSTDTVYMSMEFNGDKKEMERMGSMDSCDTHWPTILKEFEGVTSLKEFEEANRRAAHHYLSYFGDDTEEPIEVAPNLDALYSEVNELYVVNENSDAGVAPYIPPKAILKNIVTPL